MLHLKVTKIIKSKGLSVTNSRIAVLKLLVKSNKPLRLRDIKRLLKSIDRVTLFRVINSFETKKIIHKIILDNGETLYALCKHDCADKGEHVDDHIHFSCNNCKEVFCLDVPHFPVFKVPNFLFDNLHINGSGLCADCYNIKS